jgi:hypothetical protein
METKDLLLFDRSPRAASLISEVTMSRTLGIAYAVLATVSTGYFLYAVFDSLYGDYVGGEVTTVWILTAVAGLVTALLWWAAAYQLRKARIADRGMRGTGSKDSLTRT